jgi:hypothetical protein
VGYGEADIDGLNVGAMDRIPRMKSFFAGADVGFPLAFHFQFRETYTQVANISFNGQPRTRGELYFSVFEAGLKLFLPIPFFQLWVGGGYLAGSAAITNPRSRGNDTYLAAFENETKSIWGTYGQVGVDLMLLSRSGIRVYYQEDSVSTDRYHVLQHPGLNFRVKQVAAALLLRGF